MNEFRLFDKYRFACFRFSFFLLKFFSYLSYNIVKLCKDPFEKEVRLVLEMHF